MASSGSKKLLESKDEFIGEALPLSFLSTIHHGLPGIQKLIYDYYFDIKDRCPNGSLVWLRNPNISCTFFSSTLSRGIPSAREQILARAYYAGSLEPLEACIRGAAGREEAHLQNTLEQAILIAVIGLDRTIRHETTGAVITKGMAETLLDLYAELYPREAYLRVLDKVNLASPLETPEDKKREALNLAAVDTVMTAFIQNDEEKITAAVQTFNEFVANTKTEAMTNTNRYNLNLIHLIYAACHVLASRGGALPRVGTESYGQWDGKLADRFCFEIIGAAIQQKLPPRVRQFLKPGLYYVLNGSKTAERSIDIDGAEFLGRPGTSELLCGVDSYYDDIGAERRNAGIGGVRLWPRRFKTYYEQLCQLPKFIMQQPHTHTAGRCLIM